PRGQPRSNRDDQRKSDRDDRSGTSAGRRAAAACRRQGYQGSQGQVQRHQLVQGQGLVLGCEQRLLGTERLQGQGLGRGDVQGVQGQEGHRGRRQEGREG